MSDRLSLAHAIEDAGIPRDKAESVATAIAHFVEGGVATKPQLDAAKAELKADILAMRTELRGEMGVGFAALDGKIARQDVAIERVRAAVREIENRLLFRLGSLMVVLTGVILAALRYWPPR
jgi:hypothetical protein